MSNRTRTVNIAEAIRQQLVDRQAMRDGADDLAEVSFTVKLQAGTTRVRAVQYSEERVIRRSDEVTR